MTQYRVALDEPTGGIALTETGQGTTTLHPLWLRERVNDPESFDAFNNQRTYEHADIDLSLQITAAEIDPRGPGGGGDKIRIAFSDGHISNIDLTQIRREIGWARDPATPPTPQIWDAALNTHPDAQWDDLDTPSKLKTVLDGYFLHGFCIIRGTPTGPGSLQAIARKFGYLRETNFGDIFHVETKPRASDLAYTDKALQSHTDNVYREPIPGIQFLHCVKNDVAGGLSTLVDGFAIAQHLETKYKRYYGRSMTPVH